MLNVLVLGGSGGTGRWIVRDALAMGHRVTAFMRRRPPDLEASGACRVVRGDVFHPKSLEAAFIGQDAVFWCVGAGAGDATSQPYSEGTTNVLRAMQRAGGRRLVFESAFGAGDSRWGGPYARLLRIALPERVRDKERQEEIVRASRVEWMIVRPTMLTNGPRTGRYRAGTDVRVGLFPRISRADVAEFMLRQLTDATFLHEAVAVTGH
jgi:uncharacterized protein YbjT (DUF2867 family)